MTIKDIQNRNQKFQSKATDLLDLILGNGFLETLSAIIRSLKLIDKYLIRLIKSQSEVEFEGIMDLIEHELDDAVYILDRIERQNRTYKLQIIDSFLREGYDLLSSYFICCDQLIERKINESEKIL